MNDYKELIAKCDEWIAKADNLGADDLANHIARCGDAIEQLIKERDEWMGYAKQERKRSIERSHELAVDLDRVKKERDAAMEDIRVSCGTCRHSYLNNASGNDCDSVGGCSCNLNNWEWRGVQEDNDEVAT